MQQEDSDSGAELQEAFSLAESIDDKERAVRACSLAIQALKFYGIAAANYIIPDAGQWVERADLHANNCRRPDLHIPPTRRRRRFPGQAGRSPQVL
jgi:hypothetical protein